MFTRICKRLLNHKTFYYKIRYVKTTYMQYMEDGRGVCKTEVMNFHVCPCNTQVTIKLRCVSNVFPTCLRTKSAWIIWDIFLASDGQRVHFNSHLKSIPTSGIWKSSKTYRLMLGRCPTEHRKHLPGAGKQIQAGLCNHTSTGRRICAERVAYRPEGTARFPLGKLLTAFLLCLK